MDERGGQRERREYLTYCRSILPVGGRVDGRVGGWLTGDGDDGRMTAPAGGADSGSIGNICHIPGVNCWHGWPVDR